MNFNEIVMHWGNQWGTCVCDIICNNLPSHFYLSSHFPSSGFYHAEILYLYVVKFISTLWLLCSKS